ncbi:acyl-CoA dehydrogenase family protein [Pseudomonas paraeruginosa]|uniref:acyl-CoA dehydrogenase family protein n=1 Tax=Pseudomonas paraeruginosa TaxID=2994495 RepID=UPI003D266B15
MSSPYLSDSHQAFAEEVRRTLRERLLPLAEAAEERGRLCEEAWQALADHGLLSLPQRGEGFLESAVFLEELGALGYAGVRAAIGVHAYMASAYLELFGNDEQRQRYLPPSVPGEPSPPWPSARNRPAAICRECNAGPTPASTVSSSMAASATSPMVRAPR